MKKKETKRLRVRMPRLLSTLVGTWPAAARRCARVTARVKRPQKNTVMDWEQLSRLATDFFEARSLVRNDATTPWQEGRNVMLRKHNQRYLVHAAHWQSARIDAGLVQALMSEVTRHQATAGIMLCAHNVFTPAAHRLARENSILLLDSSQMQVRQQLAPRSRQPKPVNSTQAGSRPVRPAPAAATAHPKPAPAVRRRPVLRPDHEVRRHVDFMPTEPISVSYLDALEHRTEPA